MQWQVIWKYQSIKEIPLREYRLVSKILGATVVHFDQVWSVVASPEIWLVVLFVAPWRGSSCLSLCLCPRFILKGSLLSSVGPPSRVTCESSLIASRLSSTVAHDPPCASHWSRATVSLPAGQFPEHVRSHGEAACWPLFRAVWFYTLKVISFSLIQFQCFIHYYSRMPERSALFLSTIKRCEHFWGGGYIKLVFFCLFFFALK